MYESKLQVVTITFHSNKKIDYKFDNCGSLPLRRLETCVRHLYRALRGEHIKERHRIERKLQIDANAEAKKRDAEEIKRADALEKRSVAREEKKIENANKTMK